MKISRLFAWSATLLISLFTIGAQTFPYWDAADPGGQGTTTYRLNVENILPGPFIASGDAVYTINNNASAFVSWTKYGGWQALSGLEIGLVENPGEVNSHKTPLITIHDHYLYAVGFFTIDGYSSAVDSSDLSSQSWPDGPPALPNYTPYTPANVQIARYDFYTGTWAPLGQSFTARNVTCPTSIAVDSRGWIYVGFLLNYDTTNTYLALDVDMLDVSTNEGSSWSVVGGSLTIPGSGGNISGAGPYSVSVGISCLHADGTNLYVGGDFSGSGAITSSNLIRWDGAEWHSFNSGAGVYATLGAVYGLWFDPGGDAVNAIQTIGTNVYVAGNFDYPSHFFARFSSVTGDALLTGDPAGLMGWYEGAYDSELVVGSGGLSLAVNNGNLYFGGAESSYSDSTIFGELAVCSNPTAGTPSWSTNLYADASDTLYCTGNYFLASARDGNAVFVAGTFTGQDASTTSSGGFSRLVVSADVTPTSSIANVSYVTDEYEGTTAYLSMTGTPHTIWQVQSSSDGTDWTTIGGVTFNADGNATFTNSPDFKSLYYRLYQNSLVSATNCDNTLTITIINQFSVPITAAVYGNGTLVQDGLNVDANSSQAFTLTGQYGVNYTISANDEDYIYCSYSDGWVGFMDTLLVEPPDNDGRYYQFSESGNLLCPTD